jgi:CDP-diacylglycerol--glycerol-3-phosphate 3-phosphatidyltransferase
VLDSSCDRIADAAIFGSIGWYFALHGQRWMLLAAILCLVLGALTSYIRARAEGAGFTCTVGIAERAERLIVVLVGTGLSGALLGLPYVQAVALWLLVAASTITVVQRFATVYRQSKQREAAVGTAAGT